MKNILALMVLLSLLFSAGVYADETDNSSDATSIEMSAEDKKAERKAKMDAMKAERKVQMSEFKENRDAMRMEHKEYKKEARETVKNFKQENKDEMRGYIDTLDENTKNPRPSCSFFSDQHTST